MANSILQGNMPFNKSVYSKDEVDRLIEEHSHYIVSPSSVSYIRPKDDGNGYIERSVTVGLHLDMECGDGLVLRGKDGEETVWTWEAQEPEEGQTTSTVSFVGPFASSSGETVYVPSDSPVFEGFNPEAFYAKLWMSIRPVVGPGSLIVDAGTEIAEVEFSPTGIPVATHYVRFPSASTYDFPDSIPTDEYVEILANESGDGQAHPTIAVKSDGVGSFHMYYGYDSEHPILVSLQGTPLSIVYRDYQSVTVVYPGDAPRITEHEVGRSSQIHYKNFPQWFTFTESGVFEGHGVEASGGVAGTYYDDETTKVINDSRTIATLKDLSDITATTFAGEPPIDVVKSENTVTVLHHVSGVDPGNYGDAAGSRTVDFGDRIQSVYQHVDITGHINSISTSDIVLPSNASKLLVGDESNDMYVKDAINEIREEIGGGGSGGSIIQRLDAVEGRLDSNDERLDALEARIDSNDIELERISADYISKSCETEQTIAGPLKVSSLTVGTRLEGSETGEVSVASGYHVVAGGIGSHAEGTMTEATGQWSHAEGHSSAASGAWSHAEGTNTVAGNSGAHAEGDHTEASGYNSHAEGDATTAAGDSSHAEGSGTTADGDSSHAEGIGTNTTNEGEHAEGRYNVSNTGPSPEDCTISSVGIGDGSHRKNAVEVMSNGDVYVYGVGNYDGTNATDPSTLSLGAVIDDISNDIGSIQFDRIVSKNGSTIVRAEDDGTATISFGDPLLFPPKIIATVDQIEDLSSDVRAEIDDLSNDLHAAIDDLSDDVHAAIDDLSNDFHGVIDDLSDDVHAAIDDLSNDLHSELDDLSDDVSLRAMDDNVIHKTGPLVEGQAILPEVDGSGEIDSQPFSINFMSNGVQAGSIVAGLYQAVDEDNPETRFRTAYMDFDDGTGHNVMSIGVETRAGDYATTGRLELIASIFWNDNEIRLPDDSGTLALEENFPQPSDSNPKMDGVVSPGTGAQASRWDHVHPSDISKLDVADVVSKDISFIDAPLYEDYGKYHAGDVVRTSYTTASCIASSGPGYWRAKKDMNTSGTNSFSNDDWCNDSKRNEYWEYLGNSASVRRGEIVSYKGDLYRVKSDAWLTNADYQGDFQAELDFYLEKISLADIDKSYIKEEAYGSRATIGQSSLTLSLQGQAPLVPFTLVIPDGFKLYWENGSNPHEVMYSAPSGGTTISFSTPPVYDQSYQTYVLVPDGYTFVDMDTMLHTDSLLWFESGDPNSDSWGLDVGSANGASGTYLGFDDFKSPNPTVSYAQFGYGWANKIPTISRTAVSPVSKTVATVDQMPVPATALPLVDAASAVVGVSDKYAREDHIHPLADRIISQNGDTVVTADNTGIATVAYTVDEVVLRMYPGYGISGGWQAPSDGEDIKLYGPITSSLIVDGWKYWVPEEYKDSTTFYPPRDICWYLSNNGTGSDTPNSVHYGTTRMYAVDGWDTAYLRLITVPSAPSTTGTNPTLTQSTRVTKELATVDQIHAAASSSLPLAIGVANAGSSDSFSRGDHVHPYTDRIVAQNSSKAVVSNDGFTYSRYLGTDYGHAFVRFEEGYSITIQSTNRTYTAPAGGETIEFKGPYYNTNIGAYFWYPTTLQDDPQDQFDPNSYAVWYLYSFYSETATCLGYYGSMGTYDIYDYDSKTPSLQFGSATGPTPVPVMTRAYTDNYDTKYIVTSDQPQTSTVQSVNGLSGSVRLDATNLYMDSNDQVTIAEAIQEGGAVSSVNGDVGDVHLDAMNLYMDSNDQVTIAEAIDSIAVDSLYSPNKESRLRLDNDGSLILTSREIDKTELLLHAGYSVSYGSVSYSTGSNDEIVEIDGAYQIDISGDTYFFWVPASVQDPSSFNPFDPNTDPVWYFWVQIDPSDPFPEVVSPEFLSYANGPQYVVNGWGTGNISIQLMSGTDQGTPPSAAHLWVPSTSNILSTSSLSTAYPQMDGVANAGISGMLSRADHIHPSDDSRVAQGVNNRMNILADGSVVLYPVTYIYRSLSGIDANGDNIVTYIPAGTDNGGVFVKLITPGVIGQQSLSGILQLTYMMEVTGGSQSFEEVILFSATVTLTYTSDTSSSISVDEVVISGVDANDTNFSTTQTYQYITNGNASVIDYTGTGGSFVINCGPLTWVSGGQNPNTTIDIPSTKTLATTKYVDDAVAGGGGGGVSSVNGKHGVVVLDGTDILVDESNDVRTIAEALSDVVTDRIVSPDGDTVVTANNDGTATLTTPLASLAPPLLVFDDFSIQSMGTLSNYTATIQTKGPFTFGDDTIYYVPENEADPTGMADLNNYEICICRPFSASNPLMLFTYGGEFGYVSDIDTTTPEFTPYGTPSGTLTITRASSKTTRLATADDIGDINAVLDAINGEVI